MPLDRVQSGPVLRVSDRHDQELRDALERGDDSGVATALAAGATLAQRDEDGWTPLMWASLGGETSILERFLQSPGALDGIDAISDDGFTALMVAGENQGVAVMKRLLEVGSDPNILHPSGANALLMFLAPCSEDVHPDLIQAFVMAGIDLDATDEYGRNALMYAAEKFSLQTARHVALEMSPHRINDVDAKGYTALFYAAQHSLPMAQLLVENGARADFTAVDGMNPEQRARDIGAEDIAQFLQATARQERDAQVHIGTTDLARRA